MTKRSEVRSPLVEIHTKSVIRLQNGFRPRWFGFCYPSCSTAVAVERCFLAWCGQVNWEFLTAPRNAGRDSGIGPVWFQRD